MVGVLLFVYRISYSLLGRLAMASSMVEEMAAALPASSLSFKVHRFSAGARANE